ncbi:MAG: Pr6Pr family membrane protein [Ginsengibacter sp.]
MSQQATNKYYASVIGSAICWFALIFQLYLILHNRTTSVCETLMRYFTFYTILTNLLVAICFTAEVVHKNKRQSFFTKPSALAATVVYISVVGVVYNVVLRFAWQPTGLQRVVDELLHLIIPVYFILYWLILVPKIKLKWSKLYSWLIYPAIYLVVVMIRGAFARYYPYPFVNVTALGYQKVTINCMFVLLAFLFFSFLIILISRSFVKRTLLP